MRFICFLMFLVALCGLTLSISASGVSGENEEAAQRSDSSLNQDSEEDKKPSKNQLLPFAGLKLTGPQLFSVSLGLGYLFKPKDQGPMIQVEPGLHGCKYQIGYIRGINFGLVALKISLLQTWYKPLWGEKDQLYVGVEFEPMVYGFNMNLGGYGHISGNEENPDFILSGGIGLGF